MGVAWTFTDGVEGETYVFDVNPNDGGTPQFEKTLTTIPSMAGLPIVFEGRDKPETFQVSGVLIEQEQLNAFQTWFVKNYQVKVTDDLGREFWILITGFNARRAPSRNHPWRHTYTLEYIEVDW